MGDSGEKDIIFKGQYSEGVFSGGEETLAAPPKIPRFGWREEVWLWEFK